VKRWRLSVAGLLLGALGLPLALPLLDLLGRPAAWRAWDDSRRLSELAWNSSLLIGGTLLFCMPLGVIGAVLFQRTDLPLRRFYRLLTVLTLFVPLPLVASAWQATLGTGGWLPLAVWSTPPGSLGLASGSIPWKPWASGLGAAIWVHAMAGLPWVVWIVGLGLGWVERDLEEDALLHASPLRVLRAVTLPRCRAAIFAAAVWVALQTATEITVTDMMQVRTFAEEVYTQFILPDPATASLSGRDVLARAVAVSLPAVALAVLLVLAAAWRWESTLPPLQSRGEPLCLFPLGALRWPWLVGVTVVVVVLAGVPVGSLIWKAGLHGSPQAWSLTAVMKELAAVGQAHGAMLAESVLLGLAAGTAAALLALVACWLAAESREFRVLLLLLVAIAWAMPGPVLGIGLKECINATISVEEMLLGGTGPLRAALYDGPSLLPVFWASLVRYFPYAAAILWPVVRLLPRELRDAARVDGAGPLRELRFIVAPLTRSACLCAALAVAVLSLGELSAGKLVETPGAQTFAHWVFERMHYGVTQQLAALCLVLLAAVGAGGALVFATTKSP